jgi:hypothetical protein
MWQLFRGNDMGQYLAIGLVTTIRVEKSAVEKAALTTKVLKEKMATSFSFVADLYSLGEDDEYYVFTLKKVIFHGQLQPFLASFYPTFYDDKTYYDNVLLQLKEMAPEQWLEWADSKSECAFQFDSYGMSDYVSVGFTRLKFDYESVMLSMQGKVLMEEYNQVFKFFNYTMKQTFKSFPLSGALRVYITG